VPCAVTAARQGIMQRMAIPAQKYSAGQREALAVAFEVRRIRPARRVVEMAAAGELEHNGVRLEPFEANEASVRGYAAYLRKRRAGQLSSPLEDASRRDAVERLRVRLVRAADAELRSIERRQREGVPVPGEEIRQVARAAREIASLPGLDDPAPVAPGLRTPGTGQKESGTTRGGLAGQIIAAAKRGRESAVEVEPESTPPSEPALEPEIGSDEWRRRAGERLAAETWARFEASRAASS